MSTYLSWLRSRFGPALLPLCYVTAIVRDDAGRILFQQRSDFGTAWWGLPGGLLEFGETPLAGLHREVLEETGLHITPTRCVGLFSSPDYIVHYPNGDQAQQITFCYECHITSGTLRADGDESLALQWYAPEALPPRPKWYASMLAHALSEAPIPYFDPPQPPTLAAPYPTLMSTRAIVGHAPMLWPGANAAIIDTQGHILLEHRADFNIWGLPAGALDVGESLSHTAVREAYEETGLHVEPVQLLGTYGGYPVTYPNEDVLYPIGAVFLCRVVGGQLQASAESHQVKFFAPTNLPSLLPHFAERVQWALTAWEKQRQ